MAAGAWAMLGEKGVGEKGSWAKAAGERMDSLEWSTGTAVPKDEVGLTRAHLLSPDNLARTHSGSSIAVQTIPNNERLGQSGHVAIASPSREAAVYTYDELHRVDSEVELDDAPAIRNVAADPGARRSTHGPLRSLVAPRSGLAAHLLRLPNRLLYVETSPDATVLIISRTPNNPNNP